MNRTILNSRSRGKSVREHNKKIYEKAINLKFFSIYNLVVDK